MIQENQNPPMNNFELSVENYSHFDVSGDVDSHKRSLIPNLVIKAVIVALCIALFGYSMFMIASNAFESEKNVELYDGIRVDQLESEVKPSTPLLEPSSLYTLQETLGSSGEYADYVGGITSLDDQARRSNYYRNFMSFSSNYPDTYAWIYVNHTKIDYPVMKGPYTDYYLYRNFMGVENAAGSIVADSSMSNNYDSNLNNVFYGHCMKNGSMFRTLKTFMEGANRNTLAQSMNIEIYTKDGLYIYKVFSGYRDDSNFYAKTSFSSNVQYLDFLRRAASMNTLSVSTAYNESSKICTLITCANVTSNEDERYVIHGMLTNFIPSSQL